jgi:hypothetical protein
MEQQLQAISSIWSNVQLELSALQKENDALKMSNTLQQNIQKELDNAKAENVTLHRKLKEVEDYQNQFSKVSHIVAMERENCRLKSHIQILERRIEIYQQRTLVEFKEKKDAECQAVSLFVDIDCQTLDLSPTLTHVNIGTSTDGEVFIAFNVPPEVQINDDTQGDASEDKECEHHAVIYTVQCEQDDIHEEMTCSVQDNQSLKEEHEDIKVEVKDTPDIPDIPDIQSLHEVQEANEELQDVSYTEKKIKGIVYYLSDDDNTLYIKNNDDSVGEPVGRLESTTLGKTKVKWFKKSS